MTRWAGSYQQQRVAVNETGGIARSLERHRVLCGKPKWPPQPFSCEDGHADEQALLEQVIPAIEAGDLWIDGCNFCTFAFPWAIDQRRAFFITPRWRSGL